MTDAVSVMPRAEYKFYMFGANSHRLTWIQWQLNEFVVHSFLGACIYCVTVTAPVSSRR